MKLDEKSKNAISPMWKKHQNLLSGQVVALRGHCMHTAHAEAGILTQEYLSPNWLHS